MLRYSPRVIWLKFVVQHDSWIVRSWPESLPLLCLLSSGAEAVVESRDEQATCEEAKEGAKAGEGSCETHVLLQVVYLCFLATFLS